MLGVQGGGLPLLAAGLPLLAGVSMGFLWLAVCVGTLGGAAAQGLPLPSALDGSCNLGRLDARVAELNRVCCFSEGPAGSRCAPGRAACTVECAVALLPLLEECGTVMDALYSGRTIVSLVPPVVYSPHFFDRTYESCLQLSSDEVMQTIQSAVDMGTCSPDALDGVALTPVTAECADENPNCASVLTMGIECPTLVGQCDMTCGHCDATPPPKGGDRHRLQRDIACDLTNFQGTVDAVNQGCCDSDLSRKCSGGFPVECDARCAVLFDQFYTRCSNVLTVQFPATVMTGMRQLYQTCSTELPVEMLIRGLAACTGGASISANVPHVAPTGSTTAGTVITLTPTDCDVPSQALTSAGMSAVISGPTVCHQAFDPVRDALSSAGSFDFIGAVELDEAAGAVSHRLGRVTGSFPADLRSGLFLELTAAGAERWGLPPGFSNLIAGTAVTPLAPCDDDPRGLLAEQGVTCTALQGTAVACERNLHEIVGALPDGYTMGMACQATCRSCDIAVQATLCGCHSTY